jgi:hypothetical protein
MQENSDFVKIINNWEFNETSLGDIFLSLVEDKITIT